MPKAKIQPYLPSKIVEYLMLQKPILGICDNNSPSYRILKEYGFDILRLKTGTPQRIKRDTIDFSKAKITSASHLDSRIKKNVINNYEKDYSIEKIVLK